MPAGKPESGLTAGRGYPQAGQPGDGEPGEANGELPAAAGAPDCVPGKITYSWLVRSGGTSRTTPPWPTLASRVPCGLAISTLAGNAAPETGLSTSSLIVRLPCQITCSSGVESAELAIHGVPLALNRLSGPYRGQ